MSNNNDNSKPACGNARDILNKFADEQGWNDDSKIHLLCDFIESLDIEDELEDYLKNAQRHENDAGV